jgi:hypothetical protein
MARSAAVGDDAGMPRYPSFYLLGALAGCAIWAVHAPPPFPLLAYIIMVSGGGGLVLSLTYLYCFERWTLRRKQALLRRIARRLTGAHARKRTSLSRPVDAPALIEWEAASASTPVGVAPGGLSVGP